MIDRLPRELPPLFRVGHSGRLTRGSGAVRLLLTGYFALFLASLGHDDVLHQLAEAGLLDEGAAVVAEIAVTLALFLAWGALTVRLVRLLDRARSGADEG